MTPPPSDGASYFKRYRMEAELRRPVAAPALPPGARWLPWGPELLEAHALAKFRCFVGEPDAVLFPTLGRLPACRLLMAAIAERPTFCPGATWLVARGDGVLGTVQGLADRSRYGAIQNLGVVPEARGLGLGEALLLKAMQGFRAAGMRHVALEVTASNRPAVALYRRAGFRCVQTLYKAVPMMGAEPAPVPESPTPTDPGRPAPCPNPRPTTTPTPTA